MSVLKFHSMTCFRTLVLGFAIFLGAGCAWFSSSKPSSELIHGKIVDRERLKQGGKLLVIPFKAGEGVEASEELDQISFAIAAGLVDTFKKGADIFEIIADGHTEKPELVLKGYITEMDQPHKIKKWVLQRKTIGLGVECKLIEPATGKTLFVFEGRKDSSLRQNSFKDLGVLLAQDIGRFILDTVGK